MLVSSGIASSIYSLAYSQRMPTLARIAMMFSPATLYQGLVETLAAKPEDTEWRSEVMTPGGVGMGITYLLVAAAFVGLCLLLLRLHYRKVASR
jgi:hypothetical protein